MSTADFSLLAGRMPISKLADRTLQWRTDLAHSRLSQVLHVSSAQRVAARHQIERDFVEARERLHGLPIRARARGSGREDPVQHHKAVERRADHDDDNAGGALHRRLVSCSSFYFRVFPRDTRGRLCEINSDGEAREITSSTLTNAPRFSRGKIMELLRFTSGLSFAHAAMLCNAGALPICSDTCIHRHTCTHRNKRIHMNIRTHIQSERD